MITDVVESRCMWTYLPAGHGMLSHSSCNLSQFSLGATSVSFELVNPSQHQLPKCCWGILQNIAVRFVWLYTTSLGPVVGAYSAVFPMQSQAPAYRALPW